MTTNKQQPEALATFAEASRSDGKKPDELGLAADKGTQPIPTSPDLKNEAATRVLQEGVEHKDKGSRELIDDCPIGLLRAVTERTEARTLIRQRSRGATHETGRKAKATSADPGSYCGNWIFSQVMIQMNYQIREFGRHAFTKSLLVFGLVVLQNTLKNRAATSSTKSAPTIQRIRHAPRDFP